jgi:hypothetical protein
MTASINIRSLSEKLAIILDFGNGATTDVVSDGGEDTR